MIYISKKDPSIKVKVIKDNDKYKTVDLEYISGDSIGKVITITTATLKRWWDLDFSVESVISIDMEKVNTPYPEPKVQKYVKVPESVIKYEARKSRLNTDLPTYEELGDIFAPIIRKINKSYYICKDKVSIQRKGFCVQFNVPESYMEVFAETGIKGEPNNDKDRPLKYVIKTQEELNRVKEVLLNA